MSKALGFKKAAGGPEGKSLVGHESSQRQEGKSSMIQLAKRTFRDEIKRDWSWEKSTAKTQLCPWTKPKNAWKISTEAGSRLCRSKGSNGMRSGGVGSDATVVGRGPVPFSGCLG